MAFLFCFNNACGIPKLLDQGSDLSHGSLTARMPGNFDLIAFLSWGNGEEQDEWIRAASATYTTAHGNAKSLTHWARTGIEPTTSWFLVGFVNHWATTGTPTIFYLLIYEQVYLSGWSSALSIYFPFIAGFILSHRFLLYLNLENILQKFLSEHI